MRIRNRYNRVRVRRRSAMLDKPIPRQSPDEWMSKNTKKIRREVKLNGASVWVTADSEQEYAEKLLKLSDRPSKEPASPKHPFRAYAERWYNVFSKPNVCSTTALTYRRQLDYHIYPALADKYVEDLTVDDVQTIFNRMGRETRTETKNKVKIVLNQILRLAVEERILAFNPFQSTALKIKGLDAVETKPYSVSQMKYLAAHLPDVKNATDRAWLALSIALPLRPEEVLGLKWENVDLATGVISVRNTVSHPTRNLGEFKTYTKTSSSRRDLVMDPALLQYLKPAGPPGDFVIGGSSPLSYTKLRSMRKRIEKDTGFDEPVVPRRFRTTVATDISDVTHDLKLVQKMLGHASPQMTLRHYDKGRKTAIDATAAISQRYGVSN